MPQTQRPHRAVPALRGGIGAAEGSTQFHHGLIENTDVRRLRGHGPHQRSANRPLCPLVGNVIMAVRQPGHNPEHVSVHRRLRPPEGRGGNGGGRIVPDAWQL